MNADKYKDSYWGTLPTEVEQIARWIVDNTRYNPDPSVPSKGSRVEYYFEFLYDEIQEGLKESRRLALEASIKSIQGNGFPRCESTTWNDPKISYGAGVSDALEWAEQEIRALAAAPKEGEKG